MARETKRPDPVTIHLICAAARCTPDTAEKAIVLGLCSLRRSTQDRLRPVFERLGLPTELEKRSA